MTGETLNLVPQYCQLCCLYFLWCQEKQPWMMYYKFCQILTVLLHTNNIEKSSGPSDVIWWPHTYGVNVNSGVLWFCKQEASTSGHSSDIFIKCPMRVCFLDGSLFSAVFQKPPSFFVKYWRNPCTGLNKIINKALRKFSISWFSFTFLMLLAPINFFALLLKQ